MPGLSAASTTGDPGDTLIVVVSGRAKVVIHSADGGELTPTVIRPGGRRSLAREPGYPAGQALALAGLSIAAMYADYLHSALRLARQAEQIPGGRPGWIARDLPGIPTDALIEAGYRAAAGDVSAAGLALSRDAGNPGSQPHPSWDKAHSKPAGTPISSASRAHS